jgi:hypothetical protein
MHDRTGLKHVGAVRHRQRHDGGLVDQQDRDALVAQTGEQVIHLLDQLRCKAE